tara:strand:+ start:60 stop:503 length:444 start_codon:yes stop_codon:yes gene_type:complete
MKTKYNIKTINPQSISDIRQIIKDSLNVILEDNGLILDFGNATYDSDSVKFTNFKVRLANADNEMMKFLKQENQYRIMHDEKPFDLEKEGTMNGQQYTLVGYNRRARKMPYIVKRVIGGGEFKIAEHTAIRMFVGLFDGTNGHLEAK